MSTISVLALFSVLYHACAFFSIIPIRVRIQRLHHRTAAMSSNGNSNGNSENSFYQEIVEKMLYDNPRASAKYDSPYSVGGLKSETSNELELGAPCIAFDHRYVSSLLISGLLSTRLNPYHILFLLYFTSVILLI